VISGRRDASIVWEEDSMGEWRYTVATVGASNGGVIAGRHPKAQVSVCMKEVRGFEWIHTIGRGEAFYMLGLRVIAIAE
jgi:hypothetical protein